MSANVLFGLVLGFASAAAPAPAHVDELAGAWSGTWTKAEDPLAVTVRFEHTGDRYTGAFDSDALQVAEIPFSDVKVSRAKVRFVLTGDASTTVFDGTLAGDEVTGTFTEGDIAGTFHLARMPPAAPILKREVTFANGDVKLAGEMVLPEGPGRHPAVVFLHGSGAEGRWASRYLARKFTQQGFVSLVYDKRGVGQSTGDWKQSGFEDLANDAVEGVRFLQTQPEVDPSAIGVYGHSQGGTIAPLVAVGEPTLGFIMASAASGLDPAEVEIYSLENSIGVPELTDAERADAQRFVREIVEVAYHGRDRADLDAMAKEFGNRAWYFTPPPPSDPYWSISRKIALFRPLDQWRQVHVPVLLVFGSHDERVPPVRSADAIVAALKSASNAKVTLKMFPNADHTFKIVPQAPPNGWTKSVPDYAGTLVNWARAQQQN